MSTRGRWLLAVALAAFFVLAAYYGRQGNDAEQTGSTQEVRRDGAPVTEPIPQPVTQALRKARGEDPAEDQLEATDGDRVQLDALDERVRSFTTPVERALAGMEDLKLRVPFEAIPELKETLRQFAAESDDPNWAVATEGRILGEISRATGLSAIDVQVDCRTTMCRVLLTKPSSSPSPRYRSFNELVDSFRLKTIWILALPDENGTPINFAYIRRVEDAASQPGSQ